MSERIRILLADDHPILTTGLKYTIENWEEFEVVGTAKDGLEAVKLAEETRPDIVLLDMQMPELPGQDAARMIKAARPEVRIVVLTTFNDHETLEQALSAGCDGFLLKVISPEQLRASLHSVMNGLSMIDSEALQSLQKFRASDNVPAFSAREITILEYICLGASNREIAEKLSLQPGTIKNIVSLLLSKTFCVSRADLTRYAIEHQLVRKS